MKPNKIIHDLSGPRKLIPGCFHNSDHIFFCYLEQLEEEYSQSLGNSTKFCLTGLWNINIAGFRFTLPSLQAMYEPSLAVARLS